MTNATIITEQCGAKWIVSKTEQNGDRAFWVQQSIKTLQSVAKPGITGFYAPSIEAAAAALSN